MKSLKTISYSMNLIFSTSFSYAVFTLLMTVMYSLISPVRMFLAAAIIRNFSGILLGRTDSQTVFTTFFCILTYTCMGLVVNLINHFFHRTGERGRVSECCTSIKV